MFYRGLVHVKFIIKIFFLGSQQNLVKKGNEKKIARFFIDLTWCHG